jgi:hypothetical protein
MGSVSVRQQAALEQLFAERLLAPHAAVATSLGLSSDVLRDYGDSGAINWRGKPRRRVYAESDITTFLIGDARCGSTSINELGRSKASASRPRGSGTTKSRSSRPSRGNVISIEDRLAATMNAPRGAG